MKADVKVVMQDLKGRNTDQGQCYNSAFDLLSFSIVDAV